MKQIIGRPLPKFFLIERHNVLVTHDLDRALTENQCSRGVFVYYRGIAYFDVPEYSGTPKTWLTKYSDNELLDWINALEYVGPDSLLWLGEVGLSTNGLMWRPDHEPTHSSIRGLNSLDMTVRAVMDC